MRRSANAGEITSTVTFLSTMPTLRDAIFGLAVAGALAGITYGTEGIPGERLPGLRGGGVIERCPF